MSQINDALRRASHASKNPGEAAAPPLPPPPLPEVESSDSGDSEVPLPITSDMLVPPVIGLDAPRKSSRMPIVLIILVVFCGAGAAGFYLVRKVKKANANFTTKMEKQLALLDEAIERGSSNALTNAVSPTRIIPNASVVTAASNTITSTAIGTPKPAPAPAPPVKAPAVSAAMASSTPAKFPPLRLQSIFYRPSNPSVMINGKLLCISDEIQGVLVADIQPASVTLVLSGYTNVLTLR